MRRTSRSAASSSGREIPMPYSASTQASGRSMDSSAERNQTRGVSWARTQFVSASPFSRASSPSGTTTDRPPCKAYSRAAA